LPAVHKISQSLPLLRNDKGERFFETTAVRKREEGRGKRKREEEEGRGKRKRKREEGRGKRKRWKGKRKGKREELLHMKGKRIQFAA